MTITLILIACVVFTNANALTVKSGVGQFTMDRNGTYHARLTYYGSIGEKNAMHQVIIKVLDKKGFVVDSYSIPMSMLDLNNETFRYVAKLSGVYPYDTYDLKFSYGNQTVTVPATVNIISQTPTPPVEGNPSFDLTGNSSYVLPLQQFRTGVPHDNIHCTENYILLSKREDGSPACVKPVDIGKLLQLGWASDALPSEITCWMFCPRDVLQNYGFVCEFSGKYDVCYQHPSNNHV